MARKKEMCSSENHEPGAGIVLMKLEELHSFEGHPFKVERNQKLFELRCSIEKEGVLVPLLVRKNPHGDGYEIIAGHRRKEAALWAGLTEVPVIIRELDDDQSVIAMVDSNLQREKILPSEKAFAYKMRLEAMKHQGRAEADTSDPLEPKCKTELVNVSELEAELQKLGKVKIQKKGGYLFVSDYGSQYSILSRYGIRPFSVYGRDYRMTNGDALDFRYSNIEIINQYAGVQRKESASGQVQYQTKIHVNGDFIVGTYADEISAAIAYNKAADTLAAHGISKAYARNYIVSMTNEQYHTAYTSISISKKLTAPAP